MKSSTRKDAKLTRCNHPEHPRSAHDCKFLLAYNMNVSHAVALMEDAKRTRARAAIARAEAR